jgi:hypothetical protein
MHVLFNCIIAFWISVLVVLFVWAGTCGCRTRGRLSYPTPSI